VHIVAGVCCAQRVRRAGTARTAASRVSAPAVSVTRRRASVSARPADSVLTAAKVTPTLTVHCCTAFSHGRIATDPAAAGPQ